MLGALKDTVVSWLELVEVLALPVRTPPERTHVRTNPPGGLVLALERTASAAEVARHLRAPHELLSMAPVGRHTTPTMRAVFEVVAVVGLAWMALCTLLPVVQGQASSGSRVQL